MEKNKKTILYIILLIILLLIIIVVKYCTGNYDKLEDILECQNYQCVVASDNENIDYMFLDNYHDYYEYRARYNKTYPEFVDNIKDYSKDFFEENKLIVFSELNLSIEDIGYQGTEAIIYFDLADHVYQYGEVNVIEVRQSTESIRFDNGSSLRLEGILDCDNYVCKTTNYYNKKINYMFLDNYYDYYEYRGRYNKTYSEFTDNIKEYDKKFFEKNKLIVFFATGCGIENIEYQGTEAIINFSATDCYDQVNVIEVKQSTESIIFNNLYD